jgi:hypothetical protein
MVGDQYGCFTQMSFGGNLNKDDLQKLAVVQRAELEFIASSAAAMSLEEARAEVAKLKTERYLTEQALKLELEIKASAPKPPQAAASTPKPPPAAASTPKPANPPRSQKDVLLDEWVEINKKTEC